VLVAWVRAERLAEGSPARRGPLTGEGLLAVFAAGIAFAGDLAFYHAALPLTSVANASFISNLAPVISVIAALALFGEKPGVLVILGLVCGADRRRRDDRRRTGGEGGVVLRQGDILAVGAALPTPPISGALKAAAGDTLGANVTLGSTVVAATDCCVVMAITRAGRWMPHSSPAAGGGGDRPRLPGAGGRAERGRHRPAAGGRRRRGAADAPGALGLLACWCSSETLSMAQAVGGALIFRRGDPVAAVIGRSKAFSTKWEGGLAKASRMGCVRRARLLAFLHHRRQANTGPRPARPHPIPPQTSCCVRHLPRFPRRSFFHSRAYSACAVRSSVDEVSDVAPVSEACRALTLSGPPDHDRCAARKWR